ncbi:HAMP domain-containing histidine kinase [Bacillus sp. ISL-40]|uniref:sensor histidine kinase n=1 Tax=unclassified Bacillus (in: firmicutes) TaxID=185979 RepID=UPI001BECD30A|nr:MULTISPECIES: HAMP domain-containing sensor histidine kinase [unclassified Bacillus (in: firmicutes)]MBT2697547.1 HAMP domain-containing histidine kinase [Bacillus sp. ISL-40]MBT2720903.1 HAMP domain-containing histidine kinase [Bacillus sp. ISL-46]MBT2742251.1 HAMP domain-containing histidine kinase [Bacillus sp. ISL-77]
MSIKTRLLLSYMAMTFIPIVLFALIATTLVLAFYKDMAGTGDGKGMPAFWEMANQRRDLIAGVKFMTKTDPDRFNDNEFLKSTDEQLNRFHSGLVVMKNNQVSYNSPFVNSLDLKTEVQELQTSQSQNRWGKSRFTVEKYNITFSNRVSGTVYILSDIYPFFMEAKKFFPMLVLSLLLVIGLTNGVLTILVSRSFIKPLYTLKHAADQIKKGNLDYEVKLERKDEIGELGASFEEMRARLLESIDLQLQYEENRKELISNISHDLKTPITGIKACVQGIQDGIADTVPKRNKYMNMIAKKAEDMDHLIDELMLYSKLDLKRLPFHVEPMDIQGYLRNFIEELRLDPRMEDIKITFSSVSDRPVLVMGDHEKLSRVMMNIIDNSLKYMNKQQKEIKVELFDDKAKATVHIRDNGPGIDSAELLHIFNRFYRVDPSRNTDTGGSGLGLAIVKQMVEGQGGNVWAESQLGEGTSMYFTLPKIQS